MIPLKCAELMCLITVVACAESQFDGNNKPFLLDRDEITEPHKTREKLLDDDLFMFTTMSLPNDSKWLPTLSNGHLGFTVLSDEVYMNGLYNGKNGLSHRAKIPNFANILLADCLKQICKYTLNMKRGIFIMELYVENQFIATHLLFAHRFLNRALINQIHIQRLGSRDDIKLKLIPNPGNEVPTKAKNMRRRRKPMERSNNFSNNENPQSTPYTNEKDDLNFTKNETIDFDGVQFRLLCARIKEVESDDCEQNKFEFSFNEEEAVTEEEPIRKQEEDLDVHVPEEITLERSSSSISYEFVMAVDSQELDVRQEMMDVLRMTSDDLLKSHTNQWEKFWSDLQIDTDGNDELVRAVISSIFYLVSSLPSETTNLPQHPFYGLSPTGLGRGGSNLDDYEGHNFWDTEMWMLPPVSLLNPYWGKDLLNYRFLMLSAAKDYATASGYLGSRFPWESAATGIEVIQPGYEYMARSQQHITGDISFGLRYFFSLTHDIDFMKSKGCILATEIAKFWKSRVTFNDTTKLYDINHVMGPDESHDDVNNNVYTNVVAKYALQFGWFAECFWDQKSSNDQWLDIAEKIKILHDLQLDYHPQYEGYEIGTEIKQADTILLGYPLMYAMNISTRKNDLKYYGNLTRKDGPAMASSMAAVNYLDVTDFENAFDMLTKSYQPFILGPFNVWSEVISGEEGATNFMTGAGGFLQAIFNGIFGIRLYLTHLEIRAAPQLPGNLPKFSIKGFSYLKSKFRMNLTATGNFLEFYNLKDDLKIEIEGNDPFEVEERKTYNITGIKSALVSTLTNPFAKCIPPEKR